MLAAFAEAIRATTQPCTLLLILPATAMAVITRGRLAPFMAICGGAVVGGWVFIANVVALSSIGLQISGVLVAVAIGLTLVAVTTSRLRWAATPSFQSGVAGVVAFASTLWWRPCVGVELGAILTAARVDLPTQVPGITAYMLGALVPVLAVVLLIRAVDPGPTSARWATWTAGGIGLAAAGALAIGRHDELVTALTRWSTG